MCSELLKPRNGRFGTFFSCVGGTKTAGGELCGGELYVSAGCCGKRTLQSGWKLLREKRGTAALVTAMPTLATLPIVRAQLHCRQCVPQLHC